MLGKVLNDRYKILKELGKGGMAIVFEAQDLILDRKVALKMLRPENVNDQDFVKRFRHEAKAVARLSHPNVVNIFDIGQEGKYHYLVMENIDGMNLKDLIKKKGSISIEEALEIANQICSALVVAHRNKIIHCDIKPHNILLTEDNQVKVTDFGIARAVTSATMTITDTIVGSAHYFSPEQARGGEIKTHSDLYSLGIVIYEMITGEVPFRGDSPISVALKHIQEKPRKPSLINTGIPDQVEKLVMKAIAKDPKERFSKAKEMKDAIEEVLEYLRNEMTTEIIDEENGSTKVIKKSELKAKSVKKNKSDRDYLTYNTEKSIPRWLKWVIGITLLFLISIIGFIIFYQMYMEVPVVEVPDLIGMDFEEARKEAKLYGLFIKKQNEGVNHPEIPENHIISQYPQSGERIRQTRDIMVTISKGPAVLKAPDLITLTIREARVILDNQNLSLGEIEYMYSDNIEKGKIIAQSPEPETEIDIDTLINITISNGPEPKMIEMPNIIGIKQEEAIKKLNISNLKVGEIDKKPTRRFLAGQIAAQSYNPGTKIPENTKVDLTVSTGLLNSEGVETHIGVKFSMYVPSGNWNQKIRYVIIDNNGRDIIYEGTHHPGDYVPVYFNSVGSTRYEVYINDELTYQGNITE